MSERKVTAEEARIRFMCEVAVPTCQAMFAAAATVESITLGVHQCYDDSAHDAVYVTFFASAARDPTWPPSRADAEQWRFRKGPSDPSFGPYKDDVGGTTMGFASYCKPFGTLRYDLWPHEAGTPYAIVRRAPNRAADPVPRMSIEIVGTILQPHWEGPLERLGASQGSSLPSEGFSELARRTVSRVAPSALSPEVITAALGARDQLAAWHLLSEACEEIFARFARGDLPIREAKEHSEDMYWTFRRAGLFQGPFDRGEEREPGVLGRLVLVDEPDPVEDLRDLEERLEQLYSLWNAQEQLYRRWRNQIGRSTGF